VLRRSDAKEKDLMGGEGFKPLAYYRTDSLCSLLDIYWFFLLYRMKERAIIVWSLCTPFGCYLMELPILIHISP